MINPIPAARRAVSQFSATKTATGVSVPRQVGQLLQVAAACGMGRAEYFKYRLWRDELSTVERLTYTSQRERRRTETATNRPQGFSRPRLACPKSDNLTLFEQHGLPVPELLGRIGGGAAATVTSTAELSNLLARIGDRRLVIKPEDGSQGADIFVAARADAEGVVLLSGVLLPVAALWHQMSVGIHSAWRVERWVEPDALVGAWRPGTTPTVRMLTLAVGGVIVVHSATAKIPVGDSGVDNLARGNLVAAVDLATGKIGSAIDGSGMHWYDVHPQSGAPIRGVMVPHWHKFVTATIRGAELFLPRRAFGWDVAIGANGPIMLETNTKWCEKLVQLPTARGLTHGAFIRLLHEVGAGHLLARRRMLSGEWRRFEAESRDGAGR